MDVRCKPRDYDEWVYVKDTCEKYGCTVFRYRSGEDRGTFREFPYLTGVIEGDAYYVQGNSNGSNGSSGLGVMVSVDEFIRVTCDKSITPLTYCQVHKFSLI